MPTESWVWPRDGSLVRLCCAGSWVGDGRAVRRGGGYGGGRGSSGREAAGLWVFAVRVTGFGVFGGRRGLGLFWVEISGFVGFDFLG